ncbi:type II toxin-antitoxin system RelE family toxin [Spirosoma gilvum]
MKYSVTIKKSALKAIESLPKKIANNVSSSIRGLADNPRPAHCKKLKGVDDTYRIRIGDYRVLYTIDDSIVTVEVVKVGNRKDIYD